MPAGHLPVGAASSGGAVAEVPAGQRYSLGGVSMVMPAGWKAVPPASAMRKAEYVLPGSGGDASLVVFYFGPDQGGDLEANIERWYGQFTQPDGKTTKERSHRSEKAVGSIKATLVDINGTYTAGGMGGGSTAPLTGARMLGAILGTPSGSFFFKLVGPQATVDHWNSSFEQFIDSALPE